MKKNRILTIILFALFFNIEITAQQNQEKGIRMNKIYVLIHGNSGCSNDMELISKQLPENSKKYNLDLPYHGKSTYKLNQLSIENCAQYLIDNITDNSNLTIIGYSDGANIAMNIPWMSKLKVTNLVLISPNINPDGIVDGWRNIFNTIAFLTKAFPFLEKYHKRMKMMIKYKYQYNKLNIPTTLIYAKNDLIKKDEKVLVANMCNTEIIEIENATHFNIIKNIKLLEIIRLTTASSGQN